MHKLKLTIFASLCIFFSDVQATVARAVHTYECLQNVHWSMKRSGMMVPDTTEGPLSVPGTTGVWLPERRTWQLHQFTPFLLGSPSSWSGPSTTLAKTQPTNPPGICTQSYLFCRHRARNQEKHFLEAK